MKRINKRKRGNKFDHSIAMKCGFQQIQLGIPKVSQNLFSIRLCEHPNFIHIRTQAHPFIVCTYDKKSSSERPRFALQSINPVLFWITSIAAAVVLVGGFRSYTLGSEVHTEVQAHVLSAHQRINNNMLRYGNYCGPGPEGVSSENGCAALKELPAVDGVDRWRCSI